MDINPRRIAGENPLGSPGVAIFIIWPKNTVWWIQIQPIWKILVKMGIFPIMGVKIENI